ncbi:MAG: hypothetical protein ACPLXM_10525 [Bacteroidales bacterium]
MRSILLRNGFNVLILIIIAFAIGSLLHHPVVSAEILVPVLMILVGTTIFMVVLQKVGSKGDAAFIRYFLVLTVLKIIVYFGISLFLIIAFRLEPKSFLLALLGSYLVCSVSSIQWILAKRGIKKNRP